ncbi:MAG TPA: hypothetical protein VFB38_05755 [Chthonomonadaceae bacterium]|nr:hypothetical protein [Chthonomonadaceae bacterium]
MPRRQERSDTPDSPNVDTPDQMRQRLPRTSQPDRIEPEEVLDTGHIRVGQSGSALADREMGITGTGDRLLPTTGEIGNANAGPVKSSNLGDEGNLGDVDNVDTSATGARGLPSIGNLDPAGTGNAGNAGLGSPGTALDAALNTPSTGMIGAPTTESLGTPGVGVENTAGTGYGATAGTTTGGGPSDAASMGPSAIGTAPSAKTGKP